MSDTGDYWRPSKRQPGWSKDGKCKAFTIEELVAVPENKVVLRRALDVNGPTIRTPEQAADEPT